jgi:23S rRNA U2552 (ribose-2'-O)-methylase RlmE/FtsJ
MASVTSVLEFIEGTTPLAVFEALSSAALSWDPQRAWYHQELHRVTDRDDGPQPFYACMRALDTALVMLRPGESRNFMQYDRDEHNRGDAVLKVVFKAIHLVAVEAARLGL